tara:strand:- start:92 stop:511 length:420 start_codon:yes stop_codon:yes gene_type:complete
MPALETLIKVAEQELEEQQKHLSQLNEHIRVMEQRRKDLINRVEEGFDLATQDPSLSEQSGLFSRRAELELQDLKEALEEAEQLRERLLDKLRDIFAEKKKNETILENKREKALKEQQKKHQNQMDELGAAHHQRKSKL